MTATIVLSTANSKINQPVSATLTISNSGLTDVTVLSVTPLMRFTGSTDPTTYNTGVALGQVALGPGQNVTVPASGTLKMAFGVDAFAPSTGPMGAGSGTYDVLAEIRTSDGSTFRPTAATLEVDPLSFP